MTWLPDVGEQLAADFLFARLVTGENAARGGKDRDTHTAEDARNISCSHIAAKAGTAHAFQAGDGAGFVDELCLNLDILVTINSNQLSIFDIALFFQNLGNIAL